MLGIKFIWECPSCGSIISTLEPFSNKKLMKAAVLGEPTKCSCGRASGFKIIRFEKCEYEFKEIEGNIK